MPLTADEKEKFYTKHQIPMTNMIREIERQAVSGDSHRLIEVTTVCLHDLMNALRLDLGMKFVEADVNPSVYGENGGGGK